MPFSCSLLRWLRVGQGARTARLVAPRTVGGGAIYNVACDPEHFPVRELPYWKSRCSGKDLTVLVPLNSSCFSLSSPLCGRAPTDNLCSENLLFKVQISCKQTVEPKRKFYQARDFALGSLLAVSSTGFSVLPRVCF